MGLQPHSPTLSAANGEGAVMVVDYIELSGIDISQTVWYLIVIYYSMTKSNILNVRKTTLKDDAK